MQTLSKRDRILLFVMALVILGAIVLKLTPSGSGTMGRNQLPLNEALSTNVKTQLDDRKMTATVKTLEPRIARMTYNMPPEQLSAYVTQDLYALADRAGVHIREIKPLRSRMLPSGSVARVPLEVRFRAPFQPNVMRFLYYAEDPARKMVVEKINITSTDTHLKSVDVAAQITVYTRSVAGTSSSSAGEGDTSESTDTTNRG